MPPGTRGKNVKFDIEADIKGQAAGVDRIIGSSQVTQIVTASNRGALLPLPDEWSEAFDDDAATFTCARP